MSHSLRKFSLHIDITKAHPSTDNLVSRSRTMWLLLNTFIKMGFLTIHLYHVVDNFKNIVTWLCILTLYFCIPLQLFYFHRRVFILIKFRKWNEHVLWINSIAVKAPFYTKSIIRRLSRDMINELFMDEVWPNAKSTLTLTVWRGWITLLLDCPNKICVE